MDSTLALGDVRIARSAVSGGLALALKLVERGKHHLNLHLNLGVGCAPSCWRIFGFRNLLRSEERRVGKECRTLMTEFLAEEAGWGASPGPGGELGCQAKKVIAALEFELKLLDQVEVSAVWIPHLHSETFE